MYCITLCISSFVPIFISLVEAKFLCGHVIGLYDIYSRQSTVKKSRKEVPHTSPSLFSIKMLKERDRQND